MSGLRPTFIVFEEYHNVEVDEMREECECCGEEIQETVHEPKPMLFVKVNKEIDELHDWNRNLYKERKVKVDEMEVAKIDQYDEAVIIYFESKIKTIDEYIRRTNNQLTKKRDEKVKIGDNFRKENGWLIDIIEPLVDTEWRMIEIVG